MKLFHRFLSLFRSWLSITVESSVSPEVAFQAAEIEVSKAMADERRLGAELMAARGRSSMWEQRAEKAAYFGDDATAREALARKLFEDQAIAWLEPERLKQWSAVQDMRARLRPLAEAVQERRRLIGLASVREQRARAREALAVNVHGNAVEKATRREDEAEALDELRRDDVAERFERSERDETIEDHLEAIKVRLRVKRPALPGTVTP